MNMPDNDRAKYITAAMLIDGTGAEPVRDAALVVEGNPLEDIGALERVVLVVKDGEVVGDFRHP